MRKILPAVHSRMTIPSAILRDRQSQRVEITVGSDPWFDWLAQERSFKFTYHKEAGAFVNVTVRAEKRGQRTYWQGWKTIQGKTFKKYIAPSANMTKAKLDEIGEWFLIQVSARTDTDDPSMKLYAAVSDLSWWVERLAEECQNADLAAQAKKEVARIKQGFGN